MQTDIIYISLKNERTKVWRPVTAEKIENGIYKIDENAVYDSEDEEWEFLPGEIVFCQLKKMSDGFYLTAIKRK